MNHPSIGQVGQCCQQKKKQPTVSLSPNVIFWLVKVTEMRNLSKSPWIMWLFQDILLQSENKRILHVCLLKSAHFDTTELSKVLVLDQEVVNTSIDAQKHPNET